MKAQGTLDKTTKDKSQIISTIAEYFKQQKYGGWKKLEMKHINTKKYKLYKSLYDMVTYKIRAHSAPSTPEGKDDVNSNPEEDKESDHLS
jgi:hypothetical protein